MTTNAASQQLPNTESELRHCLEIFAPVKVDIIDDSALHAGHAGAKDGGHYRLLIVSSAFDNKSTVMRHRMIYEAIGELMRSKIHALSIRALSPDEFAQSSSH